MKIRSLILILFVCVFSSHGIGQTTNLTFAVITDIHTGLKQVAEPTINVINDINKNPEISFVLVSGDITNNGKDEQLLQAKKLLDKLEKPFYVIPGNHEDVWSPSGGTSFFKIFGTDRFFFEKSGYCFIGTDCGPMLRHGLAHIPKENLIWLDSQLNTMKDKDMPIIFVNHYPMNTNIDNHYEVINRLKNKNIKLMICGHGHKNKQYNFDGIPGFMCVSILPGKNSDKKSGYTIVKISDGVATFNERIPDAGSLLSPWAKVSLTPIPKDSIKIAAPDYSVNTLYKTVAVEWEYTHQYDISGGFSIDGDMIYSGTSNGDLIALKKSTGKEEWSYHAGGRIYSTPAVSDNKIVFTSTNGNVYCISLKGKLLWTFNSEKAIVSSPEIQEDRVFVGFSDGSFRCLNLENGVLIWDYNQIEGGFVQASLLYNGNVYFGAWNSNLYALNMLTGEQIWEWSNNKSPAYSPASVSPVAVNDRIFVVTPDYYITCFDAKTGKIIWRETNPEVPVWFSRGLSTDGSTLFVKTRNNKGVGISTSADSMKIVWEASVDLDDDSSPTPIYGDENIVYLASKTGTIIAVSRKTSQTLWKHKISNSPINLVLPVNEKEVYASSSDGKIVFLKINH